MEHDFDKRTQEFVKDLTPLWNNYKNTFSDTAKQNFYNTYAMMLESIDDSLEKRHFAKAVLAMQKRNSFGTVLENQLHNSIKSRKMRYPERDEFLANPSFRSL